MDDFNSDEKNYTCYLFMHCHILISHELGLSSLYKSWLVNLSSDGEREGVGGVG